MSDIGSSPRATSTAWDDEEAPKRQDQLKLAGFYVGGGLYGIDIMRIKEVVQSAPFRVRPVPHAPRIVQGVITLRGVVLPVIDLRELFNAEVSEEDARLNKLIIVLDLENVLNIGPLIRAGLRGAGGEHGRI